jgi:hypothetical protein
MELGSFAVDNSPAVTTLKNSRLLFRGSRVREITSSAKVSASTRASNYLRTSCGGYQRA